MIYYLLKSNIIGGAEIYTINKFVDNESTEFIVNESLYKLIIDWRPETIHKISFYKYSPLSILNLIIKLNKSKKIVFANLSATYLMPLFLFSKKSFYIHEDPHAISNITLFRIRILYAMCKELYVPSFYASNYLLNKINIKSKVDYFKNSLISNNLKYKDYEVLNIGIIGRISIDKNTIKSVDLAIRISKFKPVKINIAGEVCDEKSLSVILKMANISNVELTIQSLNLSGMDKFYSEQSFIIHTSRIENMPLILFEAFCHGVPIFMANVGGISELLDKSFLLEDDNHSSTLKILNWINLNK